jgi:tetratricopeptide (TPR) repeat protein
LPGQSYPNAAINDEEAEKRARDVLKWLAIEGNSRWLIIFDNIDQYSPFNDSISDAFDIAEFFPGNDHGSILITSRLQGLIELGRSFPIHGLDLKDTIQLLLQNSRLLAKNTAKGLESHPGIKGLNTQILFIILIYLDTVTLASRLGGLPLAIVIAGLFIHETGTSITEYLHYYQASWSDLQLQSNPERQYQQGNILQTWISSYREIQKRDAHAAELLLFLARFDNRDIWYELIKSSHHSSNVPVWLERTISSRLAFSTSIKNLVDFSLLETKEEWGSYTMHPVVQDWCIHLSSRDNSVNSIRLNELALISVGYSVPSSSERNSLSLQQRLVPHANYVRHRDWQDGNFDTALWGAFDGLGNLYSDQGKLKEAEEMYERALAGYENALGPDHTSTLNTVNNLGRLYSQQGKLAEAEEIYERALAGYENALGPDHTSTLNTVNNFGRLYSEQGKLAEAEEMYQRALAGFEKAFGPDHSLTLEAVGNLGSLYSQQGKLAEAEEMYLRALTGFEEAFGPDHPSTLKAVRGLGRLYSQQGKLVEAEEMYLRALTGFEKAFVPDYSSTLKAVGDLGSLYSKQGKLAEADEMYQRALTGF